MESNKEKIVENTQQGPVQEVSADVVEPSSVPVSSDPVVKKFPPKKYKVVALYLFIGAIVALVGIGTGWFLSGKGLRWQKVSSKSQGVTSGKVVRSNGITEAGIADEETFTDTAEGELKEGGIDGEGTHHLDRGFGPEKDVYLTSTIIDLDSFVGKKVQVWGQTIAGQKAGWLMDVGRLKVIE